MTAATPIPEAAGDQLAAADPALATVQLVSIKQLAAALGMHPRTIWRAVSRAQVEGANGFPMPLRLGPKTIRWRLRDVQVYLDRLGRDA